jgi:hypothetical protein
MCCATLGENLACLTKSGWLPLIEAVPSESCPRKTFSSNDSFGERHSNERTVGDVVILYRAVLAIQGAATRRTC